MKPNFVKKVIEVPQRPDLYLVVNTMSNPNPLKDPRIKAKNRRAQFRLIKGGLTKAA